MRWSTTASPRCSWKTARSASRRSSVTTASAVSSAAASVVVASSANDDRLPLDLVRVSGPAGPHVLVLDPFLQQDNALEQRLGARRAAGHVDVDRDDLVDALGDGVAVPVRAAAVGA